MAELSKYLPSGQARTRVPCDFSSFDDGFDLSFSITLPSAKVNVDFWPSRQTVTSNLLDKALVINPNNDSAKINLGACYLFGNISDNPMQGILKVKEVVDKNPHNTYGQMILALGGKKSGQYEKVRIFVLWIHNADLEICYSK